MKNSTKVGSGLIARKVCEKTCKGFEIQGDIRRKKNEKANGLDTDDDLEGILEGESRGFRPR